MKRFLSMMVALIILTSHAPASCAENGERPIGSSEVILENIYTETDLPEGDPQINDPLVIEENYGEDSINETSSNTEESDDIPSEDTEIITEITYRDSDNDLGNDKNDESTTIPQIEDIINSNFYSDKDDTTEDEEAEDVFDQPSSNENDAGHLLILSDLEIGADFDDEDNEAKDAEAVADEESECAIESVSDYENIDAAEIIECSIDPIVVSSMKLMSVSIDTPSESHLMNIKVDDIVVGNPFTISWNEIEHCNHYEIAIVRIDTSDRESYITSGVNNRESLGSTTHSYTVPGSSVPSGTKSFRIYVGAASTEYPCDWSKMIRDNTVTITVRAAVNQDINISISVNGASANVSWEKVTSADYYLYSVYNITKSTYNYNRQETTNKSFSINSISSGDKYRIWVGAYANGNADPIAQHLEEITLRVDCTHELTMPDSTEHGYYKESEITDTYHIIYDRYNLVCKTCGKKVQENVEKCLGQEAHRYSDNGVCIVCHYAGSECRHVNTHKEYTRTEYEAEGKNTHTEIKYFDVVCDYCNAIIPLKTSETIAKDRSEKTEGLSHNFKNGTCKDCGYIKAAQLTVTLQRGQATAKVGDMITATASIAGGSGTYQMLWKVYCDNICENDDVTGKWISGLEHSVSYETDKAGNWYFEAIVTDSEGEETSGKTQSIVVSEAECEHDYQEILRTDLTKYEKVNDTQHRVIYTHQLVCMKCDDVKNTWISDEYKDHEYDEDGKCVCGAIKEVDPECVHEWVSTVNETKYEQTERNDRMEKHAVITVYKDVCSKCGTESSHETTEYAGHVFENGKCICGYVEVTDCDHANKREEEIGVPTYVNESEKGHIKTVKVKITCADCGVVLEEEKEISVFETHKYTDGVCVCGQLEHVHTYEKVAVGSPKYAIVDETQHSITTTYYERCTGCGETTEQKTETVNEAHNFDYQGYESAHPHQYFKRCTSCGSASLIPGKYNTANGTVQDKSNCCICYGHAWNIGDKQYINGTWYVACRRCGQLRETSAPVIESTESIIETKEQQKAAENNGENQTAKNIDKGTEESNKVIESKVIILPTVEESTRSEVRKWNSKETLFDSATKGLLENTTDNVIHRAAASVYKAGDIIGTSFEMMLGGDEQSKLDELMKGLIKDNFTLYLAEQQNELYTFISDALSKKYSDDKREIIDQLTLDIKVPVGNGNSYDLLDSLITFSYDSQVLTDKKDSIITLGFGGMNILCNSIDDAKDVFMMQCNYQRAMTYLENLESSASKDSSIYRACEAIKEEINQKWPFGITSGIVKEALGEGTKLVFSYEADKFLWASYEYGAGYSLKVANFLVEHGLMDASTKAKFVSGMQGTAGKLGEASGVLLAWQAGSTIGKMLTPEAGAAIKDEEELLRLYIANSEIYNSMLSASSSNDSGFDITSLYLSAQEAGLNKSYSYFTHLGKTFGLNARRFFTHESYPTAEEFRKMVKNEVGELNKIRKEMGLPVVDYTHTIPEYIDPGAGDTMPAGSF